jgi:hypothetical protein
MPSHPINLTIQCFARKWLWLQNILKTVDNLDTNHKPETHSVFDILTSTNWHNTLYVNYIFRLY